MGAAKLTDISTQIIPNSSQKIIPDWNAVREIINKIDDIESKNILRVSYLFGASLQELVRGQTRKVTVKGNDFFTKSIEGEEALILRIPTARRGWKPRYVAVPLNPKCEPWSEILLRYSEEKANQRLYKVVNRVLQDGIKKQYFIHYEWPPIRYDKKKIKYINRTSVTYKHLSEIREWELGLCHNFNEFDFKHFFGKFYNSDYNVYFKKLLNKSDFYDSDDIINAIEMKNVIFSPRDKYFYKVYMDIQKMIKRNYISRKSPIKLNINTDIDYSFIKRKAGKKHKILQANIKKYLEKNSNQVFCEDSNLDVLDIINGIVVECGHTEGGKLIDSFNEVFLGIENIKQFWVLQFYDDLENISSCYKFIKTKTYV